jgi:ankyrin repeat protein
MDGYTVLHDACSMGHIDIIKRLLHYKANPFSTTPHNVTLSPHHPIIFLFFLVLIQHKTPLDVAQNYSCHSTIALMVYINVCIYPHLFIYRNKS